MNPVHGFGTSGSPRDHEYFCDSRYTLDDLSLSRWIAEQVSIGTTPILGWAAGSRALAREGTAVAPGVNEISTVDAPHVANPIFLVASLTKPIVALAVMQLVDRGQLHLAQHVCEFLPRFTGKGKRQITVAHLLTHTSGLPDMPPDNAALRARGAPLSEFAEQLWPMTPVFTPGSGLQYSSMGFLALSLIIEEIAGMPAAEFLRTEWFEPLAMLDTALGMPDAWEHSDEQSSEPARAERMAPISIDVAHQWTGSAEHWNSAYWRKLGVPWGGLLTTPVDLARLSRHLLAIHAGESGLLSSAALAAMTREQLCGFDLGEAPRRKTPWGYGWQFAWPNHPAGLGDLLSPSAYGHWGAVGTLWWIDPARDAYFVALGTRPLEAGRAFLMRLSNRAAACFSKTSPAVSS